MLDRDTALVVLSGGQDSTTCLFWAKATYRRVYALTINYGQRHQRELAAARKVASLAQVDGHEVLTLGREVLHSTSPLTDTMRELEQYRDFASMAQQVGDRVESTFVPMRNALFLVVAANRAVELGAAHIVTGVCQQDNANYPDCRQAFIHKLWDAIAESLGAAPGGPLLAPYIQTPLMDLSKASSIRLAMELPNQAYEALAFSHTAYDGAYPPTGHDHATLLRAQGFLEAGVPDPLIVRAWHEGKMDMPYSANYTTDNAHLVQRIVDYLDNQA